MSTLPVTGRCFCGNVQFEVTEWPSYACHCHCESCQRASGAPFVTWTTFPTASFRVTGGKLTEHHSSPGVTRGHCSDCGSSITYAHQGRPGEIDITAACFTDAAFVVPQAHIWLEDKLPWVEINDELPKYRRRVT
ncbi:MAG: GFA family protein [Gammaproteobacteria bacterium]|nr:GFA family protein [Gammaproteobacteria bacterium]